MIKTCKHLFIDSGAHGLYAEHVIKKTHVGSKFSWFTTNEFWQYVDEFAEYVKLHKDNISEFANVDVIFNPELTWKVQEYLEQEHGVIPVPVIHYGTDSKWLYKYLDKGYDYIGLGGLGQEVSKSQYIEWADSAFDIICDTPDRCPVTKVHGFAMTAHYLMARYPWYSVDSTSWLSFASYGSVIYPPRSKEGWNYSIPYLVVKLSVRPSKSNKQSILHSTKDAERQVFLDYVAEKGFELGESIWEDGEEKIITPGLVNDDKLRCAFNALYFIDLVKNLPQWPWPFERKSLQNRLL